MISKWIISGSAERENYSPCEEKKEINLINLWHEGRRWSSNNKRLESLHKNRIN